MPILSEIFRIKSIMGLSEGVADGQLNLNNSEMIEILKGYLNAAIWTEEERLNDEYNTGKFSDEYDDPNDYEDDIEKTVKQTNPQQAFQGFNASDIDADSQIQAYLDIKKFIIAAGGDAVGEAIKIGGYERLGMDIWLTRNGHGAGFFDHSYEHEQALMDAAHNLREVDLYLGDDNKLHFSNES